VDQTHETSRCDAQSQPFTDLPDSSFFPGMLYNAPVAVGSSAIPGGNHLNKKKDKLYLPRPYSLLRFHKRVLKFEHRVHALHASLEQWQLLSNERGT
jgi:hypothetical protein